MDNPGEFDWAGPILRNPLRRKISGYRFLQAGSWPHERSRRRAGHSSAGVGTGPQNAGPFWLIHGVLVRR